MEDLLAKSGIGFLLFSSIISMCWFMLRRHLRIRDDDIKELKETIKLEVENANKHFDKLYQKTDNFNKELSRLEGYIEGKIK